MSGEGVTFGSLFSGVGGFDLGLEQAGMKCKWQCEINDDCRTVLERHFPNTIRFHDATKISGVLRVDVLCGGDPCPKHSRARSNGDSRHPDLSGHFLSLAARLKPRWLVRENVPASTVDHFDAALDALGYGTCIVRVDAAAFTGQSRQRDFIVGCYQATRRELRECFAECVDGAGRYTTRLGTRQVAPALTTHRTRYDSRVCFVWEDCRGLRILDREERESLAGFPEGWTSGFSEATRARMLGNSLVPACAEWIGQRIMLTQDTRP